MFNNKIEVSIDNVDDDDLIIYTDLKAFDEKNYILNEVTE